MLDFLGDRTAQITCSPWWIYPRLPCRTTWWYTIVPVVHGEYILGHPAELHDDILVPVVHGEDILGHPAELHDDIVRVRLVHDLEVLHTRLQQ